MDKKQALGYAGVSPLQGSLRTGLIPYLSFVVLIIVFVVWCRYWEMSLFAFVVGFIGRCWRECL